MVLNSICANLVTRLSLHHFNKPRLFFSLYPISNIIYLSLLMNSLYTSKLLKNYSVQEYMKEYISFTTMLLNQDIRFSKISYEASVV